MASVKEIQERFLAGCEKRFKDTYEFLKGKKVWIYGSGMYGRFLARALVDYGCVDRFAIQAFINDFESGFELDGIPVVKLSDCSFPPSNGYYVVIGIGNNENVVHRLKTSGVTFFADTTAGRVNVSMPLMYEKYWKPAWTGFGDILKRLERYHELGMGEKRKEMEDFFRDEKSLAVLRNRLAFYETGRGDLLAECPIDSEDYFVEDVVDLSESEIYVDLGAYTGDTVQSFVDHARGRYRKIMAFEPDQETFRKLEENTMGLANIELVRAATGNQNGEVLFQEEHGLGSAVTEIGQTRVQLVRLDDFLPEAPTLVKMDIEGAELDTLKGMERIIREHHPKLIVCVYHKVEDLYEIPKYLKELVPEYRFKLKQREMSICETVLYAEV